MNCTRAIIAIGGVGSRMLPWAYSGEKCMVPLIDMSTGKPTLRPVIDFIVEDCLKAGITDITFIVGEGAQAIKKQYQGNEPVDRYFASRGKAALLDGVKKTDAQATFRFIEQSYGDSQYGTTVPIYLARDIVDQPGQTLYILGDQFFHNPDGISEAGRFLAEIEKANTTTGMLALDVPADKIDHYGIFTLNNRGYLAQLEEKPAVGSTPSTLANLGVCVVDRTILPYVDANMHTSSNHAGEHYFTDVIGNYCNDGNDVAIIAAIGTYLDCGTPENWLAANNYLAKQ